MQSAPPAESRTDSAKRPTFILSNESEESINELARKLSDCKPRRTPFIIPAQLKQFRVFFQAAYDYFDESPRAEVSVSQTAEWLLDNFYVIEQAIREVEE